MCRIDLLLEIKEGAILSVWSAMNDYDERMLSVSSYI